MTRPTPPRDYLNLALDLGLDTALKTLERDVFETFGNKSNADIAEELRLHPSTVAARMRKLGLRTSDTYHQPLHKALDKWADTIAKAETLGGHK